MVTLYLLLLFSSWIIEAEELKTGDLIFQAEGTGDFSKAISASTGSPDSLNFVHVGIIEVTDDNVNVIEASPEYGVRLIPLNEFKNDSARYVIKRINIDFPLEKAVVNAKKYIGQPYDWWYLPDNEKMYCSELVYESYLDYDGNHIFETKPMNFRDEDGSFPEFWIKLFKKLGQPVPQGIPGTNPNDLSKSPFLQ